jgi:SAM-dependent methyltransferase
MIGEAALKSPDLQFVGAPAEALPFENLSFGLITAAQAAQWFDRPVFYGEVHRLLRAGGAVALIENNRNWHKSEFLADYEKLLEAGKSGYSRQYRDHDYAAELAAAGFETIEQFDCQWVCRFSAPTFLTMARSSTQVQAANRAMGPSFEAKLNRLIASNSHNGGLDVDYLTRLWVGFSPSRPAPT